MVLDDLDRNILRLLKEDARRSFRTIALMADSTVPTISARTRRMEELGIIKGYTVSLDPERFGADDAADVDIDAPVTIDCHTCGQETDNPHWAHLDGKRHPFCCTTCKSQYVLKYEQLRTGLEQVQ